MTTLKASNKNTKNTKTQQKYIKWDVTDEERQLNYAKFQLSNVKDTLSTLESIGAGTAHVTPYMRMRYLLQEEINELHRSLFEKREAARQERAKRKATR